MRMLRMIKDVTRRDQIRGDEIRKGLGVNDTKEKPERLDCTGMAMS